MKPSLLLVGVLSLACALSVGCKGTTNSAFNLTAVERDPRTGEVTGASNIGVNVDKNKLSSVNVNDTSRQGGLNLQYNRNTESQPVDNSAAPARPQQ